MTKSNENQCPVSSETRDLFLSKLKSNTSSKGNEDGQETHITTNTNFSWKQKFINLFWVNKSSFQKCDFNCSSDKININDNSKQQTIRNLSCHRIKSSIPQDGKNKTWVYPSEAQFFHALKKKNWDPSPDDMKVVVSLHNQTNERVWSHILIWEKIFQKTNKNTSIENLKLSNFKGNANKLTPRAWFKHYILGHTKPFDRHDWTLTRDNEKVDYVIDFYKGDFEKSEIFLDVRPKLNSWNNIKLRLLMIFSLQRFF